MTISEFLLFGHVVVGNPDPRPRDPLLFLWK
jgi:hypothetical protein